MCLVLALVGCATPAPPPSTQHLDAPKPTVGQVPEFAVATPIPKPPKPTAKPELYSVVVHNIEIQDLLFALARDAKLNIDIHPGITGTVSMNALDQTLTELLERIAKQVDMRYEMSGKNLSISQDSPYLKMYRVDYPNISRDAKSSISTSITVASTGGGSGGSGSNSSDSTIENKTNNRMWETLVGNLRDLLRETDKVLPEGSSETVTEQTGSQLARSQPVAPASGATTGTTGTSTSTSRSSSSSAGSGATSSPAQLDQQSNSVVRKSTFREAASVIANPESGVINVRATQRQHEKIREFLDRIMGNARRQVLIEATIVEVDLSDRFQQGIDWSLLRAPGNLAGSGIVIGAAGAASGILTGGATSSLAALTFNKASWGAYSLTSALRLLESFGTLRVLSSPKISVLNSQTSVLKVVDNEVYFNVTVTPGTPATATSAATPATYSTTVNTVPIGFLMTVTPQISDNGEVILNLRPTISRISRTVQDPNPALTANAITGQVAIVSSIPVVQIREMESILRVQSGDIAVLGGLIQDTRDRKSDEVPGLNAIPVVGELFKYQNNGSRKTELVVFLRPTVLTDASLDGDFQQFRSTLPESRSAFSRPADQDRSVPSRP